MFSGVFAGRSSSTPNVQMNRMLNMNLLMRTVVCTGSLLHAGYSPELNTHSAISCILFFVCVCVSERVLCLIYLLFFILIQEARLRKACSQYSEVV